ncbi:hypothetical protein ASZ90_009199 [hydrocarbon metagenome]|uniref:Uncharacterized protein n=1 Tax=hydrocarbon metagenome TaxID=938273 RepID=A0A0W8FJG9_9ZZZZ
MLIPDESSGVPGYHILFCIYSTCPPWKGYIREGGKGTLFIVQITAEILS